MKPKRKSNNQSRSRRRSRSRSRRRRSRRRSRRSSRRRSRRSSRRRSRRSSRRRRSRRRSRRGRRMRGGVVGCEDHNDAVARLEPRCDGIVGPINMDTIADGQGVCLAGNCFDKSALLTWYDRTNRGNGGTNPMTRQLFTLSEGLAAERALSPRRRERDAALRQNAVQQSFFQIGAARRQEEREAQERARAAMLAESALLFDNVPRSAGERLRFGYR